MSGQGVDVSEALAAWCNEKNIGRDEWLRRCAINKAVAELIEAGKSLVEEMDRPSTGPFDCSAKWFFEADARFRAALANVSGGAK